MTPALDAFAASYEEAKRVFAAVGIPCPEGRVVKRQAFLAQGSPVEKPYVIKPTNEGSSVGVHIVMDGDNYLPTDWPFGQRVMVERFIPGRELTVAVMGDRALAVTEITTDRKFYDYDAKYALGGSAHKIPADISPELEAEAKRIALVAHQCLGCRGVSRTDIRYDGKDMYVLELNTQPGMTPTSLVPEQAAHVNISFDELCAWMVENATCDA